MQRNPGSVGSKRDAGQWAQAARAAGLCWAALALAAGCSEASSEPPSSGSRRGPPESVYQRERRIEIQIELANADWQSLRYEGRTLAQLDENPSAPYRYTGFPAQVRVDGELQRNVEVKKKGFIGSLSTLKPSLRLDFDPERLGLESGLRRLTLNADVQDRSHARQCMALDLLAAAGVPASRCGFAHVVVNGVDLGTYSNVEPITGRLLRRYWSNDQGTLYEGTLADFAAESWQDLELESDPPTEHAELRQLVAALEASDEALVNELEKIVELDRFRDFWAMETLLGHWDGYANNANNYYLYLSPDSQRFEFIPWGLDQAFVGQRPFNSDFYDISVYAHSRLARRLYDIPEQRAQFRQRLAELNDQLWDEDALLAQTEAIARLAPDYAPDAMQAQRAFLRAHGAALSAALTQPAPEIVEPPAPPPPDCALPHSALGGTFSTFWESDGGQAQISLELDGSPISTSFVPSAMPDMDPTRATISLFGSLDDGRSVLLLLLLPRQLLTPGSHRFHGAETLGVAGALDTQGNFRTLGLFGDGELSFSRAGTAPGAALIGEFHSVLYQTVCLGAAIGAPE